MTRALILILALPLAGCPALDIIENKPSPYKAAHEQRMALVTPVVASVADVSETPEIEHVEAVMLTTEPTCVETFRINRCDGNNPIPWSM